MMLTATDLRDGLSTDEDGVWAIDGGALHWDCSYPKQDEKHRQATHHP